MRFREGCDGEQEEEVAGNLQRANIKTGGSFVYHEAIFLIGVQLAFHP